MAIVTYPEFLQTQTYSAKRLRFQQEDFAPVGEGVMGQADWRVSQRGAGANMSVDIAAGSAVVRGDSVVNQGLYHVVNDAVINAAVTANASGNPRIDRVLISVADSTDSGSGTDISTITVLAGTPTGGATLDNLTGAGAVPNNALLLADIVVANGAASIVDANIRTRRTFSKKAIPPLLGINDIDCVAFEPAPGLLLGGQSVIHASHDLFQSAALVYLPRRVVGATRLRWKYGQEGTTALTGNYVLAICDASGRPIVNTGSVAFTGAINTYQIRGETFAATTFEAGWYYIFFGVDTAASGALGAAYLGYSPNVTPAGVGSNPGPPTPNSLLFLITGGVTVPATILGMFDSHTRTTSTGSLLGVPQVSLSVN